MSVRVRFAPSPTGYLHVGGLRTALYCYLFARKHNGDFLLRIEDTDQERLVTGSLENLVETLEWAGLYFDEGPGKDGPVGPYIQSERLGIYKEYANKLLETGHAYRCFCTKEDLQAMRERQKKFNLPPRYDGRDRNLSSKEIEERLAKGMPFVIRQAMPEAETVIVEDAIRGTVKFETRDLEDHVLLKTDGFPTYQLANVVDDHLMKITHVFRGEEWLPSAPKNVLLYKAFGWEVPQFAHLPLILNADRTKLSKRQNDVSTQSYREKGYLKEAIINFIAMLGWSPGDNREVFSLEELTEAFSLDRLQKSGAVFDLAKLDWFNWQWRRRLYFEQIEEIARLVDPAVEITQPKPNHFAYGFSSEQKDQEFAAKRIDFLIEQAQEYLPQYVLEHEDQLFVGRALLTVEEKFLQDPMQIMQEAGFYFKEALTYESELFANKQGEIDKDSVLAGLRVTSEELKRDDFMTPATLKQAWIDLIKKHDLGVGSVMLPCRAALTGQQYSPGTVDVAWALGYDKSLQRLQRAYDLLSGQLD